MLEENKECKSCGFDTMPIVTVETRDWEYCPVCGSRLVSVKDDIEDNVDEEDVEMKKIPINGDSKGTDKESTDSSQNNDSSKDTNIENYEERDSNSNSNQQDDTDLEAELDELEDKKFVEDELDRLRDRFGDDSDSENED